MMSPLWGCCVVMLILVSGYVLVDGIAVMSVDFGSEWMKVAVVSPGVLMEIALNKESKRKTPAFISFRDGERTFGEDAQNIAVRFPANGYGYLLDLIGKKIDNPIVKLYQERFPYYGITGDPERGTVVFKYNDTTTFTPEELIGMLLRKAKEFAEESAGQPISDAVLVVPGFFNQAERRAFINAGNLSGLRVLQLMNDYAAVALNYGIFRRKDFIDNTHYILFYDMGASTTSATLVCYQTVKYNDGGMFDENPQATVVGVGYDRTLGGLEMQIRLQRYLAEKFNERKKTKLNVFENPRAMAKLFKEAGRVKNVLSANTDHYAQVEGLLDNEDFKLLVTRREFENLCSDLFDRVKKPIEQALKTSGLHLNIISQIVLVGGGTRVPKVQEKLADYMRMELGKSINADEAAVMGAVYRAAEVSNGFKVKKFIVKDAVIFPIQITFPRANNGTEDLKYVKKTIFGTMSPYPQKKMLTFNKHVDDFGFNIHIGGLSHIPPQEIEALGSLNLSRVEFTGVKEAINKHSGDNVEFKGIKIYFSLDDSGILGLTNVDFVAEKNVTGDDDQSILQKIGSSFTKLFEGNAEKKLEETILESEGGKETTKEKSEQPAKENVHKTEPKPSEQIKVEKDGAKNQTEKAEKKSKIVTIKEDIATSLQELGVPSMTKEQFDYSAKKIKTLDDFDQYKQKTEKTRNTLESFVFDTLNRLKKDKYIVAATDKERESISNAAREISDWLDEEFNADYATYNEKLSQIKSLTGPLYRRVKEHDERPEALAALNSVLNGSRIFLVSLESSLRDGTSTGKKINLTQNDIDNLAKFVEETEEWKKKMEEEQATVPLSTAPTLTIQSIIDKMAALDREVKNILHKAKNWKPRKVQKKTGSEFNIEGNADKATNKMDDKNSDPKIEKSDANADTSKQENENDIPDADGYEDDDEINHDEL